MEDERWDSSQEAEVQTHDLRMDWTERVNVNAEGILWLVANDLPPNVSGVDYSRAVSPAHAPSQSWPNS